MKLTLKVFLITFLCFSKSITCMEKEYQEYVNGCRSANVINKCLLLNYVLDATIDATQTIATIEKKLKHIQQTTITAEQDALCIFQKKYNYPECTKIIQKRNDFLYQQRHFELLDTVHDKNLPTHLLIMLKKAIERNDVNPKRFNLLKTNTMGYRYTSIRTNELSDGDFTIFPGCIAINPNIIGQASLKAQEALCLYLAHQALHSYPHMITLNEISINDTDLQKTIFKTSCITCALKSERNAELLTLLMQEIYSVDERSIDLYKQISEINLLYKTIAWIKEYVLSENQ